MDKSADNPSSKTSPMIIKLCSSSPSNEPIESSSAPSKDSQLLTSPKKPITVKMKPVAFKLCLSKDGVPNISLNSSQLSSALSLRLGAALKERLPLKIITLKNAPIVLSPNKSNAPENIRQSFTTHLSKLSDNRLDSVHGGDKPTLLQLTKPPLAMQPSNLHSDDLLDARHGGGGSDSSVVQLSPSSSISLNVVSTKPFQKPDLDPSVVQETSSKSFFPTHIVTSTESKSGSILPNLQISSSSKLVSGSDVACLELVKESVLSEPETLVGHDSFGINEKVVEKQSKKRAENESDIEPVRKKIKLSKILVMSPKSQKSTRDTSFHSIETTDIIKSKIVDSKEASFNLLKSEDKKIIVESPQILPSVLRKTYAEKSLKVKLSNLDEEKIHHNLEQVYSASLINLNLNVENKKQHTKMSVDKEFTELGDNAEFGLDKLRTLSPIKPIDQLKLIKDLTSNNNCYKNFKSNQECPVDSQADVNCELTKHCVAVKDEIVSNLVADTEISKNESVINGSIINSNHIEDYCNSNLGPALNFSRFNETILSNKSGVKNMSVSFGIDEGSDVYGDNFSIIKEEKIEDLIENKPPQFQKLKICPFSQFIKDTDYTAKKCSSYDKEIINDSIDGLNQNKLETGLKLNESVEENEDLSMNHSENTKIDSPKLLLDEQSFFKDQSLSNSSEVVEDDNMDHKLNLAESKFTTESIGEFSDGDSNQLLKILSDDNEDSSHMESQNGLNDEHMEFDILDEFECNENDLEPDEQNSDSESEISADEIDAMLEAGLGDYGKTNNENQHEVKEKVILKARGKDHFEVLPEGWIEVTHNSGMPIYLHKQSRVCCVSKPYFLGPGSTRKHEIPIAAIPCLQYLKELEKEEAELKGLKSDNKETENEVLPTPDKSEISQNGKPSDVSENGIADDVALNCGEKIKDENVDNNASEITEKNTETSVQSTSNINGTANLIFPSAKLESVKDMKMASSLDYLAIREYCQKRFEFQTITVKRFKTWVGRRKHQKQMKRKQRPFLPDSTQLITCPLPSSSDKSTAVGGVSKKEFIMNPTGKSPVCILHEYIQHTLRIQPKYIFKELESAKTPYAAVVVINDMEYGTGYGSSKKVAKSDAARAALEVLIPKIKSFDTEKHDCYDYDYQDVEFFDQVRVEDPRVCELSIKAGQPYPYQILLECLKRNYGMGDTEISIRMKNLKHQKNEFIMKVGKHKASVVCKNKRDGKHRSSQSILQQLHPHINSWGSLLRMYGKGSCKTLKEKKEEEQRITELQSKACINKPNMSILNKLKEEMMKYREKMKSKKPIGKLIPERMQLVSISDSNLKSIEL